MFFMQNLEICVFSFKIQESHCVLNHMKMVPWHWLQHENASFTENVEICAYNSGFRH